VTFILYLIRADDLFINKPQYLFGIRNRIPRFIFLISFGCKVISSCNGRSMPLDWSHILGRYSDSEVSEYLNLGLSDANPVNC